ncbi:DoxX family protein [Mariniradius sediminis]|uniref:DoxX family protein n=1 Tax=Mariniradius sediminis TaxID=2909237 RepID=A0ABS9BPL6_9BACT|nr:DoxX family protein [Mariniradius sediminis]MCF1749994.1 DoxX family protein [Mariniradius sediminis]
MLDGPSFPPNSPVNLKIVLTVLRLISAAILFQSLFYKFGSHPDSILLFGTLGVEPWGRYLLGTVELAIVVLLLIPKTSLLGAIGGIGVMTGAIFTHLFFIGINFNGDGGRLFMLASGCFLACFLQCLILKNQILGYVKHRHFI